MHRRRRSGPGRLVIEIGSRLYNDLETKIQLLIIQRHLRMAKGARDARRREGGEVRRLPLFLFILQLKPRGDTVSKSNIKAKRSGWSRNTNSMEVEGVG